mgnify:CR=1 FL=1
MEFAFFIFKNTKKINFIVICIKIYISIVINNITSINIMCTQNIKSNSTKLTL